MTASATLNVLVSSRAPVLLEAPDTRRCSYKDAYQSDAMRVYTSHYVAYQHAPEQTRYSGAEMPAIIALAVGCGNMHILYLNLDVHGFASRRLRGEISF